MCSVGITKVVDGRIAFTDAWYVCPPTGLDFTNSYIHGINASHVEFAPAWGETLDRLDEVVDGHPLVAYSPFDKGVYNAANRITAAPDRGYLFLDTLALVREHVQLDSYRLPLVVEHYGLPGFAHHEAGADSLACAQITLLLAAEKGASTTHELWHDVLNKPRRPSTRFASKQPAERPVANADADPTHPLFGSVVCFSGDLTRYPRSEAQQLVAALGAAVSGNVTKKTSIVVMGGFDPATLRPGAQLSSKVQRAMDLAATGQNITILTEVDFLTLLGESSGLSA